LPDQTPPENHNDENERVFSCEAQRTHRHAERQPEPARLTPLEEQRNQPQRQREKEQIENGLLQQSVEKDRRRVDRQTDAGGEADCRRKQPSSRKTEERTGSRANGRLNQSDCEQVVADACVDDAKEIRIERRLIENVPADPLTGGDATCPLVVAVGVAEQGLEKW
jgi:hypothetical protein